MACPPLLLFFFFNRSILDSFLLCYHSCFTEASQTLPSAEPSATSPCSQSQTETKSSATHSSHPRWCLVWCPSHSYLRSHISHVSLNQIWINFCYCIAYFSSQMFSETCFIELFGCNMNSLVTRPSFFFLLDRTENCPNVTHRDTCFGCSDWL